MTGELVVTTAQWDELRDIATVVAAAVAVITLCRSLARRLAASVRSYGDRRTLRHRLGAEQYDISDIQPAVEFYVEPDFQSVDPSGAEDFRRVISAREPLFQAIDRLLLNPRQHKFLILLADSGMGKTSFVLNYYKRHWQSRRRRRAFTLYLVPLNSPDADDLIQQIPKDRCHQAVLFLDALDEDIRAINSHSARLQELLKQTRQFRTVLITCRTQFFAKDEEIPGPTGIGRISAHQPGAPGEFFFHKLYLAPFTDNQVELFLRQKYSWRKRAKRNSARNLIARIPDLAARPMILANVDRLVDSTVSVSSLSQIYEELVSAWIQEEKYVPDKQELREFSERLAENLFSQRTMRGSEKIRYDDLEPLAQDFGIKMAGWQLRGRSLLNRDAAGNYKFAHHSIMEFLFVSRFMSGKVPPLSEPWTDLMKTFLIETIQREGKVSRSVTSQASQLPLRGCDLSGLAMDGLVLEAADLREANLSHTILREVTLLRANLNGANLRDADLHKANLAGVDLRNANLSGAVLKGLDLSEAKLAGADLQNANLNGAVLKGVDLRDVKLAGVQLNDSILTGVNLAGVDLRQVKLFGANLQGADLSEADLSGVVLGQFRDAIES